MSGALEGVRVVDFGQYIAGPLTAMLLADQGADVVRIDPPGGPRFSTPANATWNRGKRSIVLDLKNPADFEAARRLIDSADVLIENFRPGCMARLGLGAPEMAARNPRLVYCSIPGFASDDPRAGMPGWEGVIAAATDTYRPLPGAATDRPAYLGIPIASNFAAFLAATSCTIALLARDRDGVGQHIEVPLFDAMFAAIGARGMHMPGGADLSLDFTGFGVYVCADGRCVHFAPVAPRFMDWFVDATGNGGWRDEGLTDRARLASDANQAVELRRRLTGLFKTRTAAQWEALVNQAGAPLAVCRSMAEWIDTPHARTSGAVIELVDPQYGRMVLPGIPVRLDRSPGAVQGPRRALGGDRQAVLAELGQARDVSPQPSAGDAPAATGSPALSGVRVLDLTQIWAGPTAARMLAEFGADVIKINSPHEPITSHLDVNRGKRTLLLDFRTPDGQSIFWKLVESADIVLQNFKQGVAERLGIGYDDVRRRRPDIIYASISAYGYEGPWGGRRGYEVQAQAAAGAQVQFGGKAMPARLPYEINDYGTGVMGAFVMALALRHRARTGQGQRAEASLAYTATLHQSLHLQSFAGKQWDEPSGPLALGAGPLQRLYRASDRWFFFGAHERDLPRLAAVPGLDGLRQHADEALAVFLEDRFRGAAASEWVERLTAAGAGAQMLTPVTDLMHDPWVQAHGLSLTRAHEGVGMVTTIGPAPRLSRTPLAAGRPAAPPGSDAAAILREIGMSDALAAVTRKPV